MIRLHRAYRSLPLLIVVAMLPPVGSALGAGAERDRVLEGAKKEGRLALYAGMEAEEATLFTNAFSKKYPFIKAEIFRSSGEKIQARFLVEHRANTHTADVFQASIVQVYQLRNLKLLARYDGAPIDWVRFTGPTITAINAIGIPEKSPHPNAAKLFVDFALSNEGQSLLRGLRRIPARPEVLPDPPTLTKGLKLYPARPEGMIESYNDTVARFNEIFNKGK